MKKTLLLSCMLAFYANLTPSFAQESTTLDPNALLEGKWQMIASPFEGGAATIDFNVINTPAMPLPVAYAESFFTTKTTSHTYPANWYMKAELNGNKIRVGWVLSNTSTAFQMEFQEPATEYALFGTDADETHRYVYFLSENIDTQQLEPMTLWSDWEDITATSFKLPQTQQIYAVVSKNKPYSGSVGYVDIWASVKLQRVNDDASIRTIGRTTENRDCFDLSGRRLTSAPQHGLYIQGGKKVIK